SWWEIFGPGHDAYVITVRRPDGSLAAILPLYRVRTKGTVSLVSMGGGVTCTDHVSLLTAPGEDTAAIGETMGRWLAQVASSPKEGWDFLHLDGVVAENRSVTAFARGLRQEGAALHGCSRMNLWFLPVGDRTWDDYLAEMNRHDRRKNRKRGKMVDETPGLELVIPQTETSVANTLETIIELHQRRWNAEQEPGSFSGAAMCQFIHRAAQSLFQRGQLRLPTLYLNGQAIAGEIQIVGRDRVLYCYSSGMDTKFRDLEPGRIIQAETMKYAHSRHLTGVDMMRGDEPYKARLHCQPYPLIQLRAVAPRILPRLQHAAWRTGFEVKQWMRRKTGRSPLATFDLTVPISPLLVAD
ncbi:MAG: GNAT family N-acetyltransferase, partial [Pirellulaceae bacterium]